jgi:serine/threonine-protein kinase
VLASSSSDSSLIGKLLDNRYQILEQIGGGGLGAVYSARRVELDRIVAVKVLHEELVQEQGLVGRFKREAVALSRLHHPHCLAVIDFGVYESRPYLVLEYVPGHTVTALLKNGPFSAQRAVSIAVQLLETLDYFHRHHVIHRDLKSENVMLVESGGTADFVKVLDFGMAKIVTGPGADSQLSKMGFVPGTPSAMAPEQIRQLPPDPRIDIYATGILLYEMIVGQRPFRGDMTTVVKQQLSETPKAPREVVGESALSEELEQVIMRALEKDRIDRHGTAAAMLAALRKTPEARALSVQPSAIRSLRPARRAMKPFVFGGIAVLAVAAAVAAAALRPSAEPVALPPPMARAASAPPVQAPPVPAPVAEAWPAHRDLAVTYVSRGRFDKAFSEVTSSIADNAAAASADPALLQAAVDALAADRVSFVVGAFRSNPALVDALATAVAKGATTEQRHAAYEALRKLGQEARGDRFAMFSADLEQASSCSDMKDSFRKLRAMKEPRFIAYKTELRMRGKKDPHAKCLKRLLKR